MDGYVTEWGLRQALEDLHHSATVQQIRSLVRWGLLDESDAGLWPASVVERTVQALDAAREERSLPRRAILLRGRPNAEYMPPEKLRRAMIAAVRTIDRPGHQMQRVDAAMRYVGARIAGAIQRPGSVMLPWDWKPPRPSEWEHSLSWAEEDLFQVRSGFSYHLALNVLPADAKTNPVCDLGDVPFVDRIVLLTVRDLASSLNFRDRATKAERERQEAVNTHMREQGLPHVYQ